MGDWWRKSASTCKRCRTLDGQRLPPAFPYARGKDRAFHLLAPRAAPSGAGASCELGIQGISPLGSPCNSHALIPVDGAPAIATPAGASHTHSPAAPSPPPGPPSGPVPQLPSTPVVEAVEPTPEPTAPSTGAQASDAVNPPAPRRFTI
eukprot:6206417-Pleurochrysis_carterae.AAC.5